MSKRKDMSRICAQLTDVLEEEESSRKVFSDSSDRSVQELCAQINRLLERQQRMRAEALSARQSSRTMLSNISHDLKTPLTVVMGLLEMVDMEKKTPQRNKELIEKARDKTRELHQLIGAFFDLTKLESGDLDLALTKVDATAACKSAALHFYDIIQEKALDFRLNLPKHPVDVRGNADALARILNNLLANAVAYGSDGGELGLTLEKREGEAVITVWDRGKGIGENYLDQVFERMYTLEDSRNKDYQGSGLGLTITKRLVERQNGRIMLESRPFEKTEFSVFLPVWCE